MARLRPEGVLYTRVETEPGSEEYDVHRWSLGGTVSMGATPALQPLAIGCFGIDGSPADGGVTRCG
ncbi:MAG: hypothetical protein Q7J48_08945 [Nocardioides sp.]|nr:hypothetical protein [Nocardioides sp.]